MKALFALAVICLVFGANSYITPQISAQNLATQISSAINTITASLTESQATNSILTGYLNVWDITPSDSLACYTAVSSASFVSYIRGAALVAASNNRDKVASATATYFNSIGALIADTLAKAQACVAKTQDFAKVKTALNADPSSAAFATAYANAIASNTDLYQTYQAIIYNNLNSGDYETVGKVLAKWQSLVAQNL